eukprot:GHRR01010120.1.p1 GENE.GHRR01010120.1~~GHRR01010120.1.p1  ORF type:complete len:208 (+),score=51.95 GHRR01010120.1:558-1181(+)
MGSCDCSLVSMLSWLRRTTCSRRAYLWKSTLACPVWLSSCVVGGVINRKIRGFCSGCSLFIACCAPSWLCECLCCCYACASLQNIFCFENVQELAQKAGLISASTPVLCKPSRQVYQIVMEQIGAQPSETIFIDDSPRNIAAAHELGIFTVLVSDKVGVPHHVSGADLVVSHFSQLPEMFPDIFAPITNAAIHEEVPSIVPIKVMAS